MTETKQQIAEICWKVYPDPTDIRKRAELERDLTKLSQTAEYELLAKMQRALDKCTQPHQYDRLAR